MGGHQPYGKEGSLRQKDKISWTLESRDGTGGAPVPWLSGWGSSEKELGEAAQEVRPWHHTSKLEI